MLFLVEANEKYIDELEGIQKQAQKEERPLALTGLFHGGDTQRAAELFLLYRAERSGLCGGGPCAGGVYRPGHRV